MATIAAELAPEIRVKAVAPGWVDTHMNDEVFADKDFRVPISEGLQTFTALQRMGVPSLLLYFQKCPESADACSSVRT